MITHLHALWNYWGANMTAPNAWTLGAVAFHLAVTLAQRARHHLEAERRADERHEELKRHVSSTLGGGGMPAAPDTESEAK